MEYSFEAKVVITLEQKRGMVTQKHVATDFNLEVFGELDRKQYLDRDDLPTEAGSKALSRISR